ncbi:MAG: radical SAM protein [Christensenellales bacterium]
MNKCELCPRNCGIDRSQTKGVCGEKEIMRVNTYSVFMFEEPCISGTRGSGAIFFSGCSLKCVFCQNYEISHDGRGTPTTPEGLVEIMKELEEKGVHNINLVSPTHFADQIVEALKIYKPKVPVVWNTHGYEKVETIKKLLPYVDIFLTDFKYFDSKTAKKYSNCSDYVQNAQQALSVMVQNKPLEFDGKLLKQGVVVRHLILPLHTQESKQILDYLKRCYDKQILVSVMSQFTPFGEYNKFDEINRKLTKREIECVNKHFANLDLDGFVQSPQSADTCFIPKWK